MATAGPSTRSQSGNKRQATILEFTPPVAPSPAVAPSPTAAATTSAESEQSVHITNVLSPPRAVERRANKRIADTALELIDHITAVDARTSETEEKATRLANRVEGAEHQLAELDDVPGDVQVLQDRYAELKDLHNQQQDRVSYLLNVVSILQGQIWVCVEQQQLQNGRVNRQNVKLGAVERDVKRLCVEPFPVVFVPVDGAPQTEVVQPPVAVEDATVGSNASE